MEAFSEPTRHWFSETFGEPTPVQTQGWARVAAGDHTLMLAPTGSGKTLAAFLWCIDRLTVSPPRPGSGVRAVYISPLKALAYDVERNLNEPLRGIEGTQSIRVDVRTGDTSQKLRRRQARDPGDILITTPESLFLILGSRARQTLLDVDTVIVDEIHVMAAGKRGVHLALSLERLSELTGSEPQRIGLSATQRPLDEVARFLGGDRDVSIVDASEPPHIDLQIVVPIEDMTAPLQTGDASLSTTAMATPEERTSIWPSVYPRLLELIRAHRSTIIFVNSRRLSERLAQQLNELAGEELVRAHHGSVARHHRLEIEALLKAGELPALTATSSLELGIDMGAVDLVVQIESPGSVARGLQRVGRAGHSVGSVSRGRVFPKFRGDLLEATVVCRMMADGEIEPLEVPRNTLDVLAQQLVAMCADAPRSIEQLERIVTRTYSFRDLSRDALVEVCEMLSGRYPSDRFAELRPRLSWNRDTDTLSARPGAKMITLVNAGTIPDRGLFGVHLGENGPRVGELDEEMVYESRAGETFLLGATSWRIEEITRDRVIVSPAPGEPGKMPFWRGEGPGRPPQLGRAIGELVRRLDGLGPDEARRCLETEHRLDPLAATNLLSYIDEQKQVTGTLPTDRAITVERFRDEIGDWRVTILSPLGSRIHAPWTLALEAILGNRKGYELSSLWTDDGIVMRFSDAEELPRDDLLFPDPDEVERLVVDQLAGSALFSSHFRQNAARALLLPRRRPGSRTPLFAQRLRAQNLMSVAAEFPSFPITLETYRECLQDVFDLPALVELLDGIRQNKIAVDSVETQSASPFARSLVFDYVAAYLYEGDAPLAERKAGALTLDRHLLRDLLGHEQLRDLLDAGAVAAVQQELSGRAEGYRARHADGLHDLLRRIGDLERAEISERADGDPTPWLATLESEKRALRIELAGKQRWIAIEDSARYRDAFEVELPAGLPERLLEPTTGALDSLMSRFGRTRGPFSSRDAATRYGLPAEAMDAVLQRLASAGDLLAGEFSPDGTGPEWCEPDVLRRLKRRTLAVLRNEVAAVDAPVLARFLGAWQHVGARRSGTGALREVIDQLEGAPLVFSELESRILPARVADFSPRMLDELGAAGELVWVGRGALGAKDGRVALYTRGRAAALVPVPPETWADDLEDELLRAVATHLRDHGASFFVDIREACDGATTEQIIDALWQLVWLGFVTNDTFGALRGLRTRKAAGSRGKSRAYLAAAGRWSSVSELSRRAASPTARAHSLAVSLLSRYGVVSREAVMAESITGGFGAISPVLRAMEEAGKVRRGYFVDGLSGAQYAHLGAVDRLRAERNTAGNVSALAATDPANPWGALLSWPPVQLSTSARPSRRSKATVVLVDGNPVLFVEGRKLTTFRHAGDETVERAIAEGLGQMVRSKRRRSLRIETVDGEPARGSARAPALERAGFRPEYGGFVFEL